MNKEFVPYQESLELKELGFDEPCFGSWETDSVKLPTYTHSISGFYKNSNHPIGKVTAPTFSQAFRWLYQKLDIEKGVMPLDTESQQLVLKELIQIVKEKL